MPDYGVELYGAAKQKYVAENVERGYYSQRIQNSLEYLPNATEIFANTICGRDGMSTTLKFKE